MSAMSPVSTLPDSAVASRSPAIATGTAAAELAALLRAFGLDPEHPAACHVEAEAWLAAPGLDDASLRDLDHLPFVTIDNDDSRDLDQALFIEPLADGAHNVWYALADAAYYVRPGSALFLSLIHISEPTRPY